MIPRATYRVQFHAAFTFHDGAALAPYLAELGISHLYSSPIATARAASMHGYDVVDPSRINPELGGEDAFRSMAAALRAHDIGIILDIVPNHMAVGGSDNRWWLDVLENGPDSEFAGHFDIDWDSADPALRGKLHAPFLGTPYAEALASGDLRFDYEPELGRLSVLAYGTHRFPIRPQDHVRLLQETGDDRLDAAVFERIARRHDGRDPEGRARLHALLEAQHYRLAWWRTAGDEINWRRFFDITELAGLRIERDPVFDAVHASPIRLYREGLIDGVRVDHVDGLADPAGYCRRLRGVLAECDASRPDDAGAGPAYFVVEKILARGERLSPDWGTDGTSGYDFMNDVAALLHDPRGEKALTALWTSLSGRAAEFHKEEHAARRELIERSFSAQLDAAVRAFHQSARERVATRDVSAAVIRRALTALLAHFPAYRTYGVPRDRPILEAAASAAREASPPGEAMVIDWVIEQLDGAGGVQGASPDDAARRFQQLSAPVSAKAVEDTAFYRYARLLSRTDVGFDPDRLASDAAAFANSVAMRQADFPHAMLATATHDHKRGEDVRARLAVLSEIPDEWEGIARQWQTRFGDPRVDPADAYALHQTLVGAWPPDLGADDDAGLAAFGDRVAGWQRKALREAKLRSSWAVPDEAYEAVCEDHLRRLLDRTKSAPFLDSLIGFVDRIAPAGAINGISQAVLRCTLPGVPDTYQGSEFWDLTLVDPDNRRPVNYEARRSGLRKRPQATDWRDGRIKQHAIAHVLSLRRDDPDLFADGAFAPVAASGQRAEHLFAFTRTLGPRMLLVVVPLHAASAVRGQAHIDPAWWQDTSLLLPDASVRVAELLQERSYFAGIRDARLI
jgi:(1->4)-alpha-D-glucan 1-alpha-D-glucosylmutase